MTTLTQLKNALADFRIICEEVAEQETPNTYILHYNLYNINDYSKLKKVCELLSVRHHLEITVAKSDKSDFSLVIIKPERDFVDWNTAYYYANCKEYEAVIGQDENGDYIKIDIRDMVSALCVGTSGSGKSTFLHSFINSLCCSTKNLGFVMVDCKRSELTRYNEKCPRLMCKVCTDASETNFRLQQIIGIMQDRYKIMEERKINKCPEDFHQIIIIVDELAELMLSTNKKQAQATKNMLIRLCQLGRACGIHCLLCTQTPRVAVVDGMIQANTPTKFALKTSSVRESVIAIGHGGCERLLGRGDMLFKSADDTKEHRVQTPYISSETIQKVFAPLPVRQWNTTPQKQTWWQKVKARATAREEAKAIKQKSEVTFQDCIDYDIIDD